MSERFAIYFAPPVDYPLSRRAAQWLGRDPAGSPAEPAAIAGIGEKERLAITVSARRYGFHATLKAPFTLAAGKNREDLEAGLADFAATTAGPELGRLHLRFIGGFLALVVEPQPAAVTDFAAAVVTHFEPWRAPISDEARRKRLADAKLSPRQVALLDRYGYPYVMDEYQFHMTLTDRLPEERRASVMAAARDWFAPALPASLALDRLVLFHEAKAGEPFVRLADFALRATVAADA